MGKNVRLCLGSIFLVFIFLLLFSCSTAPPEKKVSVEIDRARLEKNYVEIYGVRLSLPKGWRIKKADVTAKRETEAETSPQRLFTIYSNMNQDVNGSWVSFSINDNLGSEHLLQYYASERYTDAENRILHRDLRGNANVILFSAEGKNREYRTVFLFHNRRVEVVELVFSKDYPELEEKTAFFLQGIETVTDFRTTRVQDDTIMFIPSNSGFRWVSDLTQGLVLNGNISGYPAILRIEAADDEGIEKRRDERAKARKWVELISHGSRAETLLHHYTLPEGASRFEGSFSLDNGDNGIVWNLSYYIQSEENSFDIAAFQEDRHLKTLFAYDLFFSDSLHRGGVRNANSN